VVLYFSNYEEISLRSIKLAHLFGVPAAYDAHYLALAEQQNCEYWTADTRLWNTVKGRLSWIRWLGDYHP
jgi:predicted nucleic acid-binding protein